jgi:hypothetical protein
MANRKIMGKPFKRLDGPQRPPAAPIHLRSQNEGHAVRGARPLPRPCHITAVDTSAAENQGRVAVRVIAGRQGVLPGQGIAAVAATTEEIARSCPQGG